MASTTDIYTEKKKNASAILISRNIVPFFLGFSLWKIIRIGTARHNGAVKVFRSYNSLKKFVFDLKLEQCTLQNTVIYMSACFKYLNKSRKVKKYNTL